MIINIKFTPSLEGLIKRLGDDVSGGLRAGMINLVEHIEGKTVEKERPHAKTGNLAGGVSSSVNEDGTKGVINVTAKNEKGHDYAPDVAFGTGIYGPHKKPIRPKEKKALFWPGAKHPFRSVKGFIGRPSIFDAAKEVDPQATFEEGVMNYLRKKGW